MECSEPGAIRDEELLAYLAGEKVRPKVEQHLASCQSCTAQLAAYERLELALTSKLYRFDCPPNQVLGDYQLGLLSKELTAAVNNHLGMCTLCATEVATLAEFLANDQVLTQLAAAAGVAVQTTSPHTNHRVAAGARSVLESLQNTANEAHAGAKRIIATLLSPQPRLAFQRDSTQTASWPRSYSAENVNVSIQVEREASRRDSLQLIGFATRKGKAIQALQGTRVQLQLQDVGMSPMVYTQDIDELGNFIFSSIVSGIYTLELQFPESTIVIEQFPIMLQD